MTTTWEHYSDGEYYANVNGFKCWVLREARRWATGYGGWVADVYTADDNIVEYIRPLGNAGVMSFAEAKDAAEVVACR